MEKTNLKLYFQPPLTEELNPADYDILTESEAWKDGKLRVFRPPNVVGSYAVYHISKQGNEYVSGKMCHIYRPQLTDALGAKAWAEFNRDADSTNILTVTMPQAFLDTATYPVTVDPTFGYTSIGATQGGDESWTNASKFTLSEDGTVTAMSVYSDATSGTIRVAIYDDDGAGGDPGTRKYLSGTQAQTVAWKTWSSLSVVLGAGDWYLALEQTVPFYRYDSGGIFKQGYGMANPFGTVNQSGTNKISIYATYTAAGAAGQPYISRVQRIPGMQNWGGNRATKNFQNRFPIPVIRRF